jgi:hypothetical protein
MTICDRCGKEAELMLAAVGLVFQRKSTDPMDLHFEHRKPVFEGPVDLCDICYDGFVSRVTEFLTDKLPKAE